MMPLCDYHMREIKKELCSKCLKKGDTAHIEEMDDKERGELLCSICRINIGLYASSRLQDCKKCRRKAREWVSRRT